MLLMTATARAHRSDRRRTPQKKKRKHKKSQMGRITFGHIWERPESQRYENVHAGDHIQGQAATESQRVREVRLCSY